MATNTHARTNGATVGRPRVQAGASTECRTTAERPVAWSSLHPMIPRHYVPPWQNDIVNKGRIVQNAKQADCAGWEGHHALYSEKRERLHPEEVSPERFKATERKEHLQPPMDSSLSRYGSSLMSCKH